MAQDYFDAMRESRDPQTYQIIGTAMEVHRVLGRGFLEAVYREALRVEFARRSIPFLPEVQLVIDYKGTQLDYKYRADFVCFDEVIVEAKALAELSNIDRAQAINYLKATRYRRALILNFGAKSLQFERVVLGYA
jgi:GxxExxY protein